MKHESAISEDAHSFNAINYCVFAPLPVYSSAGSPQSKIHIYNLYNIGIGYCIVVSWFHVPIAYCTIGNNITYHMNIEASALKMCVQSS